jgi:hypothetical protein
LTLIVAVTSAESIWLLADRRLSRRRLPPRDDGRKILLLETKDGLAILGYAGLGATGKGVEPGDWMSAVLRGRNLPLEQSLGVMAKAIQAQLPRHLERMTDFEQPAHHVICPAFIGDEVRLYSIDLVLSKDRKRHWFRYTRHVASPSPGGVSFTPRVGIAGSGALYLMQSRDWIRPLLRLVRAHDRGLVSSHTVADHLARLNQEVHLGLKDGSVGPTCIVVWRFRKAGRHKGGGAHGFYSGGERDRNSSSLPTIVTGIDLSALVETMRPHMEKQFKELRAGRPAEFDKDEINATLARLPDMPDENLP